MIRSGASVAIVVLMVMTVGTACAGQITALQLADGTSKSPEVTVHYTDANGNGSFSAKTFADPMVSKGTTTPEYYCIDLWHDNPLGSTYTITPTSTIGYGNSTSYADVDNRLAWLVNQPQNTVDQRAAVQLAMWYTIDNTGFSYSGGDTTLRNDYTSLISFSGYDPKTSYTAQFWSATHDPRNRLYQDLITAVPGSFTGQSVPEPGTLVLAGLALTTAVGIRAARRRRSIPRSSRTAAACS